MRVPLRFKDGRERQTEMADATTRTIRWAEVVRAAWGEPEVVYEAATRKALAQWHERHAVPRAGSSPKQ
jgi:hypothetical protein